MNKIVAYWYDCIKNEDILEKDISINVRKKAILYPFDNDPFIFNRKERFVLISENERLVNFAKYINTKGLESYYGYPVIFYYDDFLDKHMVAPLFIITVKFVIKDKKLYLQKEEEVPPCGIQAFKILGFHTEEIADRSRCIGNLFRSEISNSRDLAEKCLKIIREEAEIEIIEPIDPNQLTNSKRISKNMEPGLYNKSMIFSSEKTLYNIYLLQDLMELKEKNDLYKTALSFIVKKNNSVDVDKVFMNPPVLPFPANEYQVAALQDIFQNKLSVITGPPGTGKSQYISNLLINLFLEGKSVLFVSHTNPAVEVVDKKINEQFRDLMIRTGKKEFRQELKGKFNDLILASSKSILKLEKMDQIKYMWQAISVHRKKLLEQQQLEQEFDNSYLAYRDRKDLFCEDPSLEQSFEEISPNLNRLQFIKNKLEYLKFKIEDKKFSLWDKVILFFFPGYFKNKKVRLFKKLNSLLPREALKILQDSKNPAEIMNWNGVGFIRLTEYLELRNTYLQLKKIRKKLETFRSRIELEKKIKNLEKDFYNASKIYIKDIYLHKMLGEDENIGVVKSFLNQVDSYRTDAENDNGIDSDLFKGTLNILKIWSSTLKSIGRTFPLNPGIFDYVIFDEASQVDLPSAAPALYRAKRAIIVGDPMQLTHIAGITRDIDKGLAKVHGLTENKFLYPSKTRYCDVSLYRSAENSLNHKPIFLTKHYRSEDQIITLCNEAFYGKRLKIMTTLDYTQYPKGLPLGVHWVNCEGEVLKHPTGSKINKKEVLSVNKVFQEILRKVSETNLSIGVVTPYSCQQDAIYRIISQYTSAELLEKHDVRILTAHKFQGSEKDIMIFSLVLASRGNGNSDTWYNIYPQILNVALSRARYFLCIVGDKRYCYSRTGVLKRLVETYDKIKKQEKTEEYTIFEKFDSPIERFLFQKLQDIDFQRFGYKIIPKLVVKRYTLDFALLGKKKIDIECDGCQHEIIGGLPVLEDIERDRFLEKEGWEVLRFPNHKILAQPNAVIEDVLNNLK